MNLVMFWPPIAECMMLWWCMMRTWFEAPIAYAPPPSPMQVAPPPSAGVCHDGQCAPLSQDPSGAQSQIAVTMDRVSLVPAEHVLAYSCSRDCP